MINKNEIFSKEFLELDFKLISDGIKKNGFFSINKTLSDNFINSVINDVESCGLSLNTNNVAGVYFTRGNQFFLTHMLAVSKSFFDYCTHEKILDICTNYLGNEYRLKALRFYENFGGQIMQWHTDNRFYDENKKGEAHTKTPGIIFLAYLSDVDAAENKRYAIGRIKKKKLFCSGCFFLIANSSIMVHIQKKVVSGNKNINRKLNAEKSIQTKNQYMRGIIFPTAPTLSACLSKNFL